MIKIKFHVKYQLIRKSLTEANFRNVLTNYNTNPIPFNITFSE